MRIILPDTITCVDDLPEIPPQLGPAIAPTAAPQRHGPPRTQYEPPSCRACGLMGHNEMQHPVVSTDRLDFIRRHVAAVTESRGYMSAQEEWAQTCVYPRMIRGYKDAYGAGEAIVIPEVNVVLRAMKAAWPSASPPFPVEPPPGVRRTHRDVQATIRMAINAIRIPRHSDSATAIPVFVPNTYTPTQIRAELDAIPEGFRARLNNGHRLSCMGGGDCDCPRFELPRWIADFTGIGYPTCSECGVVGHNKYTCEDATTATKLIQCVATTLLNGMPFETRERVMRTAFFGLLRLMMLPQEQRHTIAMNRIHVEGLTVGDVITVFNSIAAGFETRFVRPRDALSLFTLRPGHVRGRGRELAMAVVDDDTGGETPRVVEQRANTWTVDGHVVRVRDHAVGLTAIAARGGGISEDVLFVTSAHYVSTEDGGGGLSTFNMVIGSLKGVAPITENEWEAAEASV
jgi:hypothetical protein